MTEDYRPIKLAAQRRLEGIPGVTGVGLGLKEVGDALTRQYALRVYVAAKLPLGQLTPDAVIPAEFQGLPTDVIEAGTAAFTAAEDDHFRPLRGGITIAPQGGTMGCVAYWDDPDSAGQVEVALTNEHVLAPERDSMGGEGTIADVMGNPIHQPNELQGFGANQPCCTNRIGAVLGGTITATIDAAVVLLDPEIQWYTALAEGSKRTATGSIEMPRTAITGTYTPTKDDIERVGGYRVIKRGAVTQYTEGILVDHSFSGAFPRNKAGSIEYEFNEQLLIRPLPFDPTFQVKGDSGSVALNDKGEVIALLMGTLTPKPEQGVAQLVYGVGNPIKDVETRLGIRVATGDADTVHVVPNPADAPIPMLRHSRRFRLAGGAAHAGGSLAQSPLLARDEAQLASVLSSRPYADEIRQLIRTNTRVAATWRRSHGPAMLRMLLLASQHPHEPLPGRLDTIPVTDSLIRVVDVLARYGSSGLRADLAGIRALLARRDRPSYADLIGQAAMTLE